MTVGNTAPTVGDAAVTTDATVAVSGAVVVTDPDTGQTVTLTISSARRHGTASVAADGSFTYTPTGTFTGHDSFTIQGCDDFARRPATTGTVTVAIYPVAVADDRRDELRPDCRGRRPGQRHRRCRDRRRSSVRRPTARPRSARSSTRPTPGSAAPTTSSTGSAARTTQTLCDDATLTITVGLPPTDADSILATPLGPVRSSQLWFVSLLVLLAAGGLGAIAIGRRRGKTGQAVRPPSGHERGGGIR